MKVRLGPQANLHATFACIVAELLKVLYVAVDGCCLSVSCAVAVVGKYPAKGHIVCCVTVNHRTCRELVVVLLAVQCLLCTAVVLLALAVTLAVLKEHTVAVGALLPVVAVVCVQVSFVESELGDKYGVTCKLVKVVEQRDAVVAYHKEYVDVVGLVAQSHCVCLCRAEVVCTLLECMPHKTVAVCRPEERCGRCDAAVGPAVLVLDSYNFSCVREASVLYATAVEILLLVALKCDCNLVLLEESGCNLLNYNLVCSKVLYLDAAACLAYLYLNGGCGNGVELLALRYCE